MCIRCYDTDVIIKYYNIMFERETSHALDALIRFGNPAIVNAVHVISVDTVKRGVRCVKYARFAEKTTPITRCDNTSWRFSTQITVKLHTTASCPVACSPDESSSILYFRVKCIAFPSECIIYHPPLLTHGSRVARTAVYGN